MSDYSLKLQFQNSRSKNFKLALKLASKFDQFHTGEINEIDVLMKEIFEKWDYFKLLFWCVVDWKDTILEWEGMRFHSHSDKTTIFYALQRAHDSYRSFLEAKCEKVFKVKLGEIKYEDLGKLVYTTDDHDFMIETFNILKMEHEVKHDGKYKIIKIKDQPWFLRYPMRFE